MAQVQPICKLRNATLYEGLALVSSGGELMLYRAILMDTGANCNIISISVVRRLGLTIYEATTGAKRTSLKLTRLKLGALHPAPDSYESAAGTLHSRKRRERRLKLEKHRRKELMDQEMLQRVVRIRAETARFLAETEAGSSRDQMAQLEATTAEGEVAEERRLARRRRASLDTPVVYGSGEGQPQHAVEAAEHATSSAEHTTQHATHSAEHVTREPQHATWPAEHAARQPPHATRSAEHAAGSSQHATRLAQHATRPAEHATGLAEEATRLVQHATSGFQHATSASQHATSEGRLTLGWKDGRRFRKNPKNPKPSTADEESDDRSSDYKDTDDRDDAPGEDPGDDTTGGAGPSASTTRLLVVTPQWGFLMGAPDWSGRQSYAARDHLLAV
ncbi:hypothetical protein CYMTET_6444 [Cymbomonas tetramitiformis]|uniref:Uncharacterized protein n=1 Tax=Cymbomonas tetramitiformis TaxID=36881 RepID=A0AAE0GX51_9CHLO|nr:hypothetical protein CYMTET_6444 [Cymbomonas tetramitiformis]